MDTALLLTLILRVGRVRAITGLRQMAAVPIRAKCCKKETLWKKLASSSDLKRDLLNADYH